MRSEGQSADEGHLWAIGNQQAQPSAKAAATVQRQLLPQFYSSLAFTTTTQDTRNRQTSPTSRTVHTHTHAAGGVMVVRMSYISDGTEGHFEGRPWPLLGGHSHYQVQPLD